MEDGSFSGLWRSDTGAEIHLYQAGEAISGTYTARLADMTVACRGRVLVGSADGDVIGFVTSSPEPHMVTSWTGRLVRTDASSIPEIHTVRHAVDRVSQELDMARSVALETIVFSKITSNRQGIVC